jgi:hypothetical protein
MGAQGKKFRGLILSPHLPDFSHPQISSLSLSSPSQTVTSTTRRRRGHRGRASWDPVRWGPLSHLRMATGRIRIGRSLRAPKTETQSQNPNPPRTPNQVEIHHRNYARRIPETRRILWNLQNPNILQPTISKYSNTPNRMNPLQFCFAVCSPPPPIGCAGEP